MHENENADPTMDADPMDLSAAAMMRLLTQKAELRMTWEEFKKYKQDAVAQAVNELEIVQQCEGVCSATKPRKPRSDKGKPRKAKNAPESEA